MTAVLSIDPGKTGYIAYLDSAGISAYPIPASFAEAIKLVSRIWIPDIIVYEKVGPSPRQGSSAAFQWGRSAMLAEAVAVQTAKDSGATILSPTPQQWKARLGLMRPDLKAGTYRQNKRDALKLAKEIFPDAKFLTVENADACLLAHFGQKVAR